MEDMNNQIMDNFNNQSISVTLEMPYLRNLIGWATFNAIIDIIFGALSCLGIITAAYGVPRIIAGVKLLNATEEIRRYMETSEVQKISDSFSKLYSYFKINGIAIIIKISLSILFIIAYFVFIMVLISKMPDIMRNYR